MNRTRVLWRTITAAAAATAMGACSADRPLAPKAELPVGQPVADQVSSGTTTQVGDTLITVFTVDNADSTSVKLFDMAVVAFTPNSVCDLGSSYGPTEWDQPCEPSAVPVTVTAKGWRDEDGHPRVDFQPNMRFNPAALPVFITLKDASKNSADDLTILYCADGVPQCYDEATLDPSLATFRVGKRYSRRIKHFSGYNIASGFASTYAE
jgi:hypothetical protein